MTPECPVCWVPMVVLREDGSVPNHEGSFGAPCEGIGMEPVMVDTGCCAPVGVTIDG